MPWARWMTLTTTPVINIEVTKFYDNLWVRIQHNGRGISLDEQKTIFEPYAADGDSNGNYNAGKRLSFAYFIITEQHQGQIAVTSAPGCGHHFPYSAAAKIAFYLVLYLDSDNNGWSGGSCREIHNASLWRMLGSEI